MDTLSTPPSRQPLTGAQIEAQIVKLLRDIPSGIDPILDAYRHSILGDENYSTSINRQVRAFLLYRKYAESRRHVLDWGCRHALDACMVHMVNPEAEIDGCDITETMAEPPQSFAKIRYTPLRHVWQLPYADSAFDCVISSGVLEHVPITQASLTELSRVTESGGYLIITFLPNSLSYTEFISRRFLKRNYHRRRYSLGRIRRMLLEHGFEPVESGYHQLLPSLTSGHRSLKSRSLAQMLVALFKLDPYAERIWPLRMFCANLYVVARKRDYM